MWCFIGETAKKEPEPSSAECSVRPGESGQAPLTAVVSSAMRPSTTEARDGPREQPLDQRVCAVERKQVRSMQRRASGARHRQYPCNTSAGGANIDFSTRSK